MVKLIMGGAGTGKTKEIIDRVNAAVQEEKALSASQRAISSSLMLHMMHA